MRLKTAPHAAHQLQARDILLKCDQFLGKGCGGTQAAHLDAKESEI
jgi:hypothetical protein